MCVDAGPSEERENKHLQSSWELKHQTLCVRCLTKGGAVCGNLLLHRIVDAAERAHPVLHRRATMARAQADCLVTSASDIGKQMREACLTCLTPAGNVPGPVGGRLTATGPRRDGVFCSLRLHGGRDGPSSSRPSASGLLERRAWGTPAGMTEWHRMGAACDCLRDDRRSGHRNLPEAEGGSAAANEGGQHERQIAPTC